MSKEIISELEIAETCCLCTDDRLKPLKHIQKALALLEQPPAGETRAEYLKYYGYADGSYSNNCHTCKKEFVGDKRSISCKECATDMAFTGALMVLGASEASKAELVEALTYIQKKSITLFQAKDIAKAAIAKAKG